MEVGIIGRILIIEFTEHNLSAFDEIVEVLKKHPDFEYLRLKDEPMFSLLDGKLKDTQTANYFSAFYPVDCVAQPANAFFYQKHGTLLATGRLL